jgi:hypothetical protein
MHLPLPPVGLTSLDLQIIFLFCPTLTFSQPSPLHNCPIPETGHYTRKLLTIISISHMPKISLTPDTLSVDNAIEKINLCITNALNRSTRNINTPPELITHTLPPHIKILMRNRTRARREYSHTNNTHTKLIINILNREIKAELKEHNKKQWDKKLQRLKPSDNSLWKLARSLKSKKLSSPSIHYNNHFYTNKKDRAEIFAEVLKNRFTTNSHPDTNEDLDILSTFSSFLNSPSSEPKECSLGELQSIVKNLPDNKAPGPDGIPFKAIKLLPPEFFSAFINLLNTCIYLNYFPTIWKNSKVIVVPKPSKDLSDPNNHQSH